MNLKCQKQHQMKNLNNLTDHILYQIFKTISNASSRNMKHSLVNYQSKYMSTELNHVNFLWGMWKLNWILSNYATKADLEGPAGIVTSTVASKTYLANLKTK